MTQQIVLGRLLNRRKELLSVLAGKINAALLPANLTETKTKRIKITDGLETLIAQVNKISVSEAFREVNFYLNQFYAIEEAIQETNWSQQIQAEVSNFAAYPENSTQPRAVPVAKALLQRKRLKAQFDTYNRTLANTAFFNVTANRRTITGPNAAPSEALDDAVVSVGKLEKDRTENEINWIQRQIRTLDTVINQSNWTVNVEVPLDVMSDYVAPVPQAAQAATQTA